MEYFHLLRDKYLKLRRHLKKSSWCDCMRAGPACPQQSRRGRSFPPGTTYSIFIVGWDEICFLYYCKTLQIVLFKLKILFLIFSPFDLSSSVLLKNRFSKIFRRLPLTKTLVELFKSASPALAIKLLYSVECVYHFYFVCKYLWHVQIWKFSECQKPCL